MTDYLPTTLPYVPKVSFWTPQQRDTFDASHDKQLFAIFHEPRCGKSKIIVDTCAVNRWGHGFSISAALIIAWPNGAHGGWVYDAFPESYPYGWQGTVWDADVSGTKKWRRQFDETLSHPGFAVLAIGADSLGSDRCRKDIGEFLSRRKQAMAVADESDFMVEENARRSRTMHNIAHGPTSKFVKMKRILTGTPCDRAGPLDFYSQVGFLSFDILGYANPVEYAKHYAQLRVGGRTTFWARVKQQDPKLTREEAIERAKGWSTGGKLPRGRDFWTEVVEQDGAPQFRNMDEFWKRLGPYVSRATYADCFPDAKRPEFVKRQVELTDKQREVYDGLALSFRAELIDGSEVKVEHHLTRLLRLQQVTTNYWPERNNLALHEKCGGMGCEACEDSGVVEDNLPAVLIDETDPRMDAVMDEVMEGVPTIVWSRFRHGVDAIVGRCVAAGVKACAYDGRVSRADKLENRLGFQSGKYDVIVCNQAAASRALPLFRAEKHVFASNVFSFRTRKQAEERAEHGRKSVATRVIDIVARGTVDDLALLPALRAGMDVASYVMKDKKRSWL